MLFSIFLLILLFFYYFQPEFLFLFLFASFVYFLLEVFISSLSILILLFFCMLYDLIIKLIGSIYLSWIILGNYFNLVLKELKDDKRRLYNWFSNKPYYYFITFIYFFYAAFIFLFRLLFWWALTSPAVKSENILNLNAGEINFKSNIYREWRYINNYTKMVFANYFKFFFDQKIIYNSFCVDSFIDKFEKTFFFNIDDDNILYSKKERWDLYKHIILKCTVNSKKTKFNYELFFYELFVIFCKIRNVTVYSKESYSDLKKIYKCYFFSNKVHTANLELNYSLDYIFSILSNYLVVLSDLHRGALIRSHMSSIVKKSSKIFSNRIFWRFAHRKGFGEPLLQVNRRRLNFFNLSLDYLHLPVDDVNFSFKKFLGFFFYFFVFFTPLFWFHIFICLITAILLFILKYLYLLFLSFYNVLSYRDKKELLNPSLDRAFNLINSSDELYNKVNYQIFLRLLGVIIVVAFLLLLCFSYFSFLVLCTLYLSKFLLWMFLGWFFDEG